MGLPKSNCFLARLLPERAHSTPANLDAMSSFVDCDLRATP